MYREPEVIFWVFVFPILLALGLGIAFRNKPADMSRVVVVEGSETARAIMDLLTSFRCDGQRCMRMCCRRPKRSTNFGWASTIWW